MINSDILRRLRYALKFNDKLMLEIFQLGRVILDKDTLLNHLKKEEEEGYVPLYPRDMTAFLDGLILKMRGAPKTPVTQPVMQENFSNNLVLRKIKIACEFKEEDLLAILKRGGMELSKSELSALFRKKDHKNYKECGDQILRNFLAGLHGYKKSQPTELKTK
ncbi:MAG TPA: DUF1456 domain-containing protein [Candidatus Riflebacteria bacterium]|jgi:uncharacterized protein YehS (DUF1456 family)|nr:DUF1456 domain-containing protein [Candidatus Riflebacteria bacterium]